MSVSDPVWLTDEAIEAGAWMLYGKMDGDFDDAKIAATGVLLAAGPHIAADALRDAANEAERDAASCPEGCTSQSCAEHNRTTAQWLRAARHTKARR